MEFIIRRKTWIDSEKLLIPVKALVSRGNLSRFEIRPDRIPTSTRSVIVLPQDALAELDYEKEVCDLRPLDQSGPHPSAVPEAQDIPVAWSHPIPRWAIRFQPCGTSPAMPSKCLVLA
ncbi:hypothetical protein DACRYDRAFT_106136 [Dacryopinax primogenitus]|uniref:Uncharacterized protein n=1 Tax=Dacryopinax primogenitus (strain DJM 731) TaxID=1858805 RepID=M5GE42_DACPD|nr:uncharacterized protein DACRYDRAFT_106136 [Dacryopinax primogenitus]EJU02958.1 hypothetical protein DACRYDRAFT_106136 [Dacryopinax primogenitus]